MIKTIGMPTRERLHDLQYALKAFERLTKHPTFVWTAYVKPEHGVTRQPCIRDSEEIVKHLPLLGDDINTL